jgi:hypothetical protein
LLDATSTVRVRRRERIQEEIMSTPWAKMAVLATVVTISGAALVGAQSSPAKSDTYTWSGELVSLDTAGSAMTVKSRVAYQDALSELKHFKAGDRVWIVWSGFQDSSDAVWQIRRSEPARDHDENLVLPAELVSTDAPHSYITIRVKVPDGAVAAIKTVKPGEWVTVTSRRHPSSDAETVVAVRPWSHSTTD